MGTLEVIEVWIASLREFLSASGIEVSLERSPQGRSNPSCALNLRRKALEVDLIVWESGHADLSLADLPDKLEQEHFEDVRDAAVLAGVLSKVAKHVFVPFPQ